MENMMTPDNTEVLAVADRDANYVRGTAREFAVRLGTDQSIANNFLKVLESQGIAKVVGAKKSISGKGRSATIYELPREFQMKLGD